MRVVINEGDLELLEGLVLALRQRGLLRDDSEVNGILEAIDEASPVPELARTQGTPAL